MIDGDAEVHPAHRDCADPERWHAPDQMAMETEVARMLAGVLIGIRARVVVETGTWRGHTASVLSEAMYELGEGGRIYSVDNDIEALDIAQERLARRPGAARNVTLVHADSLAWAPPVPVDLLVVDCDHTRRHAVVGHMRRFLSPQAVVAVHDTADIGERLLRDLDFDWLAFPTPRGLWLGRPAAS